MESQIDKYQDKELQELKDRLKKRDLELQEEIRELKNMTKPLLETYKTAVKLGKWIMAGLILLSIIVGILVGIKSLLK